MERRVNAYKGTDLNEEHVKLINEIELKAFKCDSSFAFKDVKDIESQFVYPLEEMFFVIGNDWYIIYAIEYDEVEILEWAALDNNTEKYFQSIEMMRVFIDILLDNKDKVFQAEMLINTSYPFYLMLREKGYIEENVNRSTFRNTFLNYSINLRTYNKYFKSKNEDISVNHCVNFRVTDKFIERYGGAQTRILRKNDTNGKINEFI